MTSVSPTSSEHRPAALQLGEFISRTAQSGKLEPAVVLATKKALLDCVASTLSGAREPVVEKIKNHHAGRLPAEATVIGGQGLRLPMDAAAMVNGAMGHATDYDDVSFSMWGHATAPVLPAVLAVSEHLGLSGREFLTAFLIGLEVEMKLGAAVAPHHYAAGWHPTSTIGVFGACAGAAAASRLSAQQGASALCIAASRSAGLRANFGSMTKPMHVSFAARDGLEAVLLSSRGMTAQMAALDGTFGFIEVMADGKSILSDRLTHLGDPFDIVTPGLAYKYYPSCSDTHIAVDTLLDVIEAENITVASIARVRAGVAKSVFDNLIYHSPSSGLEGKFSMEYCLARALEKGRLGLDDFTDSAVRVPETRALMQRVEFKADPSIAEGDYCTPASIEIELKDGRTVKQVGRSARGHADRPLDDAQLAEKFDACAKIALSAVAAKKLYDMINTIENVPSVQTFAAALAG